MQEGIIQIGKIVSQGTDFLESLVTEVAPKKKGRQQYILKFCFSTAEEKVELDTTMQISSDSSRDFLFIGSAPGANSKQWYATTTNNFYHLSETIPNLCELDFGPDWNVKLQFIRDTYFVDLGNRFTSSKNRYAIDFGKMLGCSFDIREFYEKEKDRPEKELKALLKKELQNQLKVYIEENTSLKLSDIGLFTIVIDGEPLCQTVEYKAAVNQEKEGKLKAKPAKTKSTLEQAVCYNCGTNQQLRDDINIDIKSYTTNLYGFASNLDKKNYRKNLVLCQDCLNDYLAGEKFIKNRLNLRLAKFQVYLYPHFILGTPVDKGILERQCEAIHNSFDAITNFESVLTLRQHLDKIAERSGDAYYMLNMAFYKQNQKATKIQRFIQDVEPSRFYTIGEALEKVNTSLGEFFYKNKDWTFLNLKMIYYLIPIREDTSGEAAQYRNLLNLYDAILTGNSVSRKYIMDSFTKGNRIVYYQKEGYNIKPMSNEPLQLETLGIRQMALIKFMQELGIWKGGNALNTDQLPVGEDLKAYLKKGHYDEEKAALFFLGCVVGQIGTSQYKRNKAKPILKKLNFSGMELGKIKKLGDTLQGKMHQEKLYGTCEVYYGQYKQLFDWNSETWSLSKEENIFYLLSGYNFITMSAITNTGKREGESNEKQ